MKNLSLLIICITIGQAVISQQTRYYTDSDEKFKEAKEYFQKEKYSLAYPLLKELRQDIRETNKVNQPIVVQEINYYAIVCALKQNEGRAEEEEIERVGAGGHRRRALLQAGEPAHELAQ